jgi:hypothetical protein
MCQCELRVNGPPVMTAMFEVSFEVAQMPTLSQVGPMPKDPVIIVCYLAGHWCRIGHYIYSGTNLVALEDDLERTAWLVSRGAEPGAHLDL